MAGATLDRQEHLQWCDQRRTERTNGERDTVFLDESRFSLQHQDSRIHVWWHRGDAHWQPAFVIVILAHHVA
ncbi:hypothetical protein TNCV_3917111 [Trichonephila clavipes]|nr:hypothetical protein TNCV_3917111 [Trichonephila clavipes]